MIFDCCCTGWPKIAVFTVELCVDGSRRLMREREGGSFCHSFRVCRDGSLGGCGRNGGRKEGWMRLMEQSEWSLIILGNASVSHSPSVSFIFWSMLVSVGWSRWKLNADKDSRGTQRSVYQHTCPLIHLVQMWDRSNLTEQLDAVNRRLCTAQLSGASLLCFSG